MFRSFNLMVITLIEALTNFCAALGFISQWTKNTAEDFASQAAADLAQKRIHQERALQALTNQQPQP